MQEIQSLLYMLRVRVPIEQTEVIGRRERLLAIFLLIGVIPAQIAFDFLLNGRAVVLEVLEEMLHQLRF